MFGRRKKTERDTRNHSHEKDRSLADDSHLSKAQLRRATRTRLIWALLTSLLLVITLVFLILVEIGGTNASRPVLNNIYFININLSNIVPLSVPNAVLINSIAQTLGLHDFYTVGLWGYCQGYNGQGVSDCSTPMTLYWFNPVEIIQSQLLAGASIALPAQVIDILDLIRTVSNWMFGLFLSGACLTFVMIFIVPLSIYSRWATLPIVIFTFLNALLVTVASIIATVLFIIMQRALTSASQLNINADIGVEMFAFMWIAAATSILAWLIQFGMCCCCASRRDVSSGRKRGSLPASAARSNGATEKPKRRFGFGRKK